MSDLEPFRRRLDELDDQIARLLGERFQVCREVALHKREHGIPMMQPERVVAVREHYQARGAECRLPPDFTSELFDLLIGATCKLEDELIGALSEEELIAMLPDDELIEPPPAGPDGRAA